MKNLWFLSFKMFVPNSSSSSSFFLFLFYSKWNKYLSFIWQCWFSNHSQSLKNYLSEPLQPNNINEQESAPPPRPSAVQCKGGAKHQEWNQKLSGFLSTLPIDWHFTKRFYPLLLKYIPYMINQPLAKPLFSFNAFQNSVKLFQPPL